MSEQRMDTDSVITRSRLMSEISHELERQHLKWGVQDHEPLYWLGILVEEVGEVAQAMIENRPLSVVEKELIQVAAVAISAIASLRRNKT